ncbi:MAG: dipeptidase PepE, partial [Bacteroidales bacterium]
GIFASFGVEVVSIHTQTDPVKAVKEASCVVVGGGNTFHLVHELHRLQILPILRERILEGMPYMGWSAGSNVACPSMKTTNDMPIIEPASFDCLNVIPFQINPHYLDANPAGHGGETREDRIKEFMVVNPNIYTAGLREATALLVIDDSIQLIGRIKPMRVFKQGQATQEFEIGSDIQFLLNS